MKKIQREDEAILYELLYIIPNKFTEDEIPGIMSTVGELIKKLGGEVVKEVNYGKRHLAYPIKHNHYGYYILNHIYLQTNQIKELNKLLHVEDEVLRYLVSYAIPENAVPKPVDLKQEEPKPAPADSDRQSAPRHKTFVRREEVKPEPPKKKPSIIDAQATEEEQKKIKKGSAFDLEKELGVTAQEAKEALEEKGEEKTESVDLEKLDEKLDEIMKDL